MRVEEPDGTIWDVDASRLRWRPRRRRIGDVDPAGVVFAILSLPLLALEWIVAGSLGALRPRTVVVATSPGPPSRRLVWRTSSRDDATTKSVEVARRLSAGEDLAHDADEREVGA